MDYFDSRARTWDDDPMHAERAKAAFDAIRRTIALDAGLDCLEYGAGTGLLSFHIQPFVKSVTLIDTSEKMLDIAEVKIQALGIANMRTLRIDLAAGALIDGRFGLVYTLMTLHHVADTEKILGAFRGLLSEGGALCIADLVTEDGSFHAHHSGFSGHNGFDPEDLASRLGKLGFEEIRSEIFHTIERESSGGEMRRYPLFIVTCRKKR